MAVVMDFADDRSLLIAWAMDGFVDGLDIRFGPGPQIAPLPERETEFDVTGFPHWKPLADRPVTGVAAAWTDPSGLPADAEQWRPETLWSVRLEFAGAQNVVIAQGALKQAGLTFLPDSLVVLFDDATARSYTLPESHQPAFGDLLTHP
jgi:hypothetical protein